MEISSSSSINRFLQVHGHPRVQPISPVNRGDDELNAAQMADGADAAPWTLPQDVAAFSSEAMAALEGETASTQQAVSGQKAFKAEKDEAAQKAPPASEELSGDEQEQVRELKARDAEVRAHEAAHAAAAGSLASGGASYDYQRGPDGVNYAVGGEVGISLGTGSTPEERVANAEQAGRAATAPANPSGQDRAVAAQAAQLASSARAEIAKAKQEESAGSQVKTTSTAPAESPDPGAAQPAVTENAGAQIAQKAEQQDSRKAQVLQMARRSDAYREISQATSGSSRAA